jgi:hypothetical protein
VTVAPQENTESATDERRLGLDRQMNRPSRSWLCAGANRDSEACKGAPFECLFCRRAFAMLPFYGCCGGCYAGSQEVRVVVDEAHPQTIR